MKANVSMNDTNVGAVTHHGCGKNYRLYSATQTQTRPMGELHIIGTNLISRIILGSDCIQFLWQWLVLWQWSPPCKQMSTYTPNRTLNNEFATALLSCNSEKIMTSH